MPQEKRSSFATFLDYGSSGTQHIARRSSEVPKLGNPVPRLLSFFTSDRRPEKKCCKASEGSDRSDRFANVSRSLIRQARVVYYVFLREGEPILRVVIKFDPLSLAGRIHRTRASINRRDIAQF